jgi:hypothetical protein
MMTVDHALRELACASMAHFWDISIHIIGLWRRKPRPNLPFPLSAL